MIIDGIVYLTICVVLLLVLMVAFSIRKNEKKIDKLRKIQGKKQ
jgi:hypothetical protein